MAQLWKRLKGVQKLKGEKLQIASELVQWREQVAQKQNRPRRWIVKDEVIVDLARQKPADIEALSRIRDLSPKTVNRHGDKLLQIVAHAAGVDAAQWPQQDRIKSLNQQQLALGDCLMALCRVIADQNQIALATLATRKDIDSLLLNQKSSRLTQGWRFSMAGEQLLEFIHGQSSISVDQEKLSLDPR
jgi:ribonuclease D